jgi:hypothetical protein
MIILLAFHLSSCGFKTINGVRKAVMIIEKQKPVDNGYRENKLDAA